MKCVCDARVETTLRCSKCGKPICPKCRVDTPVGARCPHCAQLHTLPTYDITPKYLIQSTGGALAVAIATGVLWGLTRSYLDVIYINLLVAIAIGFAIGEAVSITSNRKRGTRLAVIAGLALPLSYVISNAPPWGDFFNPLDPVVLAFDALSVGVGIYIAVIHLR